MPEFLTNALQPPAAAPAWVVLLRLAIALLLGGVVAWIYRKTNHSGAAENSFPATLALLSVLIAMVTQVIGDNVARAFSLVGALSIVRFRTAVRDTKDTAYVIFSVVVGMAVGAQNLEVAILGILVVAVASFLIAHRAQTHNGHGPAFVATVRVAAGLDPETVAGAVLDQVFSRREAMAAGTARQGAAVEVVYDVRLNKQLAAHQAAARLSAIEGVVEVRLQRKGFDLE